MSVSQAVESVTNYDMATALELPLGAEMEAKFIALRNLQLKKIKKLMSSIDVKDKEITKLKLLGKDTSNRRTQLIQALRNKIKDLELINDVIKEELVRKTESTTKDINDMIIRKTLGGPKRFRPLSREELENKIIELQAVEKKLSNTSSVRKSQDNGATAANSAESKAERTSVVAESKTERTKAVASSDEAKAYSSSLPGLIDSAALVDEVQTLKDTLTAKDNLIGSQRDEIVRLRSRNAELVVLEEDMEFYERELKDMKDRNDDLMKHVDSITRQLAVATETINRYNAETVMVQSQAQMEIDALHKQSEKLLKQNATLLASLADAEQSLQKYEQDLTLTRSKSTSIESQITSKDVKLKTLTEKNIKLEERVRYLEGKCASLEADSQQVAILKEQLREKNIAIKEMKRNIDERDRATQLKANALSSTGTSSTSRLLGNELGPRTGSQAKLLETPLSPAPAALAPANNVSASSPAPMEAEEKEVSPRPGSAEKGQK